jgi:hypothetical protein
MTQNELVSRHLLLVSAYAKAAKLDIAAARTTDPHTLAEIKRTARDLQRVVQHIAMPLEVEVTRRRFMARG